MEIIKPLFSTKEVINRKKEVKQEYTIKHIADESKHEFYVSKDYKHFAQQLTEIENGKMYSFTSFGQWSLKHVVFHIINLIGKCDIVSTTYGLGPSSARGIVTALHSGLINSFSFLYDNKIKTYKVAAHDICVSNFPVKIASIHAKVTVLQNENYNISITGSANWSDSNDKIELTEIHTNKALAYHHREWILNSMQSNSTNPKKIINEIQQRNIK